VEYNQIDVQQGAAIDPVKTFKMRCYKYLRMTLFLQKRLMLKPQALKVAVQPISKPDVVFTRSGGQIKNRKYYD